MKEQINKKVFKSKDDKDNEIELAILRPKPSAQIEAQLVYNREFRKALEAGSLLRMKVDDMAKSQGLWSDEKDVKLKAIEDEIISSEKVLRGGAAKLASPEEGRTLALKIRRLRNDRAQLLSDKNTLDRLTAESFADTARIQFLIAATTVWNSDGHSYFKSYEDFISKSNDQVASDAMNNYLELMMGDFSAINSDLYENVFLRKYGFVDEKFRLVNTNGELVDDDYRRIDESGRFITDNGQWCDINGEPVDEAGNYIVPFVEFAA